MNLVEFHLDAWLGWIPGILRFLNSVNKTQLLIAQILHFKWYQIDPIFHGFCVGFWVGRHDVANSWKSVLDTLKSTNLIGAVRSRKDLWPKKWFYGGEIAWVDIKSNKFPFLPRQKPTLSWSVFRTLDIDCYGIKSLLISSLFVMEPDWCN